MLQPGNTEKDAKSARIKADTVKAQLVKELIDSFTFEVGLDCQILADSNLLKPEQSIIALGYCQRSRFGLKNALIDLNWGVTLED